MGHWTGYAQPDLKPRETVAGSVCCTYGTWYDPTSDYPWTGYAISAANNGWTNLKWNHTVSWWNVPYGHTKCAGAADIAWTGIGGDGWDRESSRLMQAGTQTENQSNSPFVSFWIEDYPNGVNQFAGGVPISAGQSAWVEVKYNGNLTMTDFLENMTTGESTNVTANVLGANLTSAEFVNEPEPASVGQPAPNFGTVTYGQNEAMGTWGSGYSILKFLTDNVTLSKFNSYTSSAQTATVATTGSIDSVTGQFGVSANSTNDTC